MRCLTLADCLRERGLSSTFCCRDHPGNLNDAVLARGHGLVVLPAGLTERTGDQSYSGWIGASPEEDASQTLEAVRKAGASWLVVDHYGLDARWEKPFSEVVPRILAIDDLASRAHVCDLLLDQNCGRLPMDYDGLLPKEARCLAGPDYALLRPDFPALRKASLERRAKTPEIRHVLISLGGMDADNLTCRLLEALALQDSGTMEKVSVMMSSRAPWLEQVRQMAQYMPVATDVLTDVTEVAALMAASDLALGSVGVTALERCCMGLPTLGIILAENQRPGAQALARAGALHLLDPDALESSLGEKFRPLGTPEQLLAVQNACAGITDGTGADRVADYMLERCC